MSRSVVAFAATLATWEEAELHMLRLTSADDEPHTHDPLVIGDRTTIVSVRQGDAAKIVVEHAEHLDADLIVVGAHLLATGTDHVGRLAETIARQAACATLIVPLSAPHGRDELPFRNMLCPVDFSPGSVRAYQHALWLTQQSGGSLTLLHVVDEFRDRRGHVRILQPLERRLRIAEAGARLRLAIANESLNWCHVGVHATAGAADVHIVAEARRVGADLIVMTTTPRDAQSAAPISMVSRVAGQVTCPVLVVKATTDSLAWDDTYEIGEVTEFVNREELSLIPVTVSDRFRT